MESRHCGTAGFVRCFRYSREENLQNILDNFLKLRGNALRMRQMQILS